MGDLEGAFKILFTLAFIGIGAIVVLMGYGIFELVKWLF